MQTLLIIIHDGRESGPNIYLFFITFCRWRGENVSTTEVEATISNILELEDCTSYGVQVLFSDGSVNRNPGFVEK